MPLVADVAVLAPLARALTYLVPDRLEPPKPGARVVCALGRRQVVGVVLASEPREPPPGITLKEISAVLDPEPVLPGELLRFLRELADYYLAPIGEVLRLALPAVERERARTLREHEGLELPTRGMRAVGGRRVAYARPTSRVEEPGQLRGHAAQVLARLRALGEVPVARLAEEHKSARAVVQRLERLGLVEIEQREARRDDFFGEAAPPEAPPALNDDQRAAVDKIDLAIVAGAPASFLLFGVTGSGKTEVYLHAIQTCLERGRGALVMVPEIALTPQLVARFRGRFGDGVAVIHSGLSDADRHAMWRRLRSGEVRVAIGARSALLAPVPDLGLCVVDEEHDGSFKQEEGVRYHARDMALLRAHRAGAVVVLGSATPSLESIALARRGKLELLKLASRASGGAELPKVTVIDLRTVGAGPTGQRLLTHPLHRALSETLERGEQSIIFLNRRGFAPSVICSCCGKLQTCRACSVALTFHRSSRGGSLACHYCGFEDALPKSCEACAAPAAWELEGLGTERLEEAIGEAFPSARVARLDRDVAGGAKSERILDRMRRGEIDVLVGTQMVTKGHDLPSVTLVGVVNADAALSMPDFRSAERGFQLLVQVAGRAGRRDRPGRVLIQTRSPDHPAVAFAAQHDVERFLEHELRDRFEVGYPPFSRLALVRVDALSEEIASRAAAKLAAIARTTSEAGSGDVAVLGPAPAPIAKLRSRHRFRVLLRAKERKALRAVLVELARAREQVDRRARVVIDVDPVSML